jgi:hypothetical protein
LEEGFENYPNNNEKALKAMGANFQWFSMPTDMSNSATCWIHLKHKLQLQYKRN